MMPLFKKTGFKIGAGVIGVLAVLLLAIYLKFQWVSQQALRFAGMTDATVERAHIGLNGSYFENVHMTVGNADIQIGRIEAYVTIPDFMAGQLTKLVVQDAMIGLPQDSTADENNTETVISLPTPLNLHVREVVLRNIRTFLPIAEGAPLVFSGSLIDRGEEYQLTGDYELRGESLNALGQVNIKAVKATAALSAHVDIGEGRATLSEPDISLRRGAGWVSLEISPDVLAGKAWPNVNAQLSAGSLKLYNLPLQGIVLTSSITPQKSELVLQAQGTEGSGDLTAEIKLDRTAADKDTLVVLLDAKLKNLDALGVQDLKGRGQALAKINASKPRSAGWVSWDNVSGGLDVSAQKLSLPGLMRDVETSAAFDLRHDMAAHTTVLQAIDKPLVMKGVIIPIDAKKTVSLNIPAQKQTPPEASWNTDTRQLKVSFGGLDAVTPAVIAKNTSINLTADFSGAQPDVNAVVESGEISHAVKPPAFVPVKLKAGIKSVETGSGKIAFAADLTEKNGLLTVAVKGTHDIPAQKGSVDVSIPPTTLSIGVYSLKDIFPLSGNYVQDVTGTFGLSGNLGWSKGKSGWQTTSRGEVFVRDMTGNVEGNIISNVNGVIKFDSLMPFTMTKQKLAVGSINVGLPLSAGIVVASLDAKRVFTLHQAEWTLAEGKISSSPFSLNLDDLSADITLTATDLQLASLFKIAPMDGLTANGIVDGILPLQLRSGDIALVNGVLKSKDSGFIRYNPQDPPAFLRDNGQKQIVDLQVALKAFEFEDLKLTLDGTLGKDQKIGISAKGKNPEFYNGYPVSINLNVEGPLENILKYSPGSNQIPESIRKQLEEYENAHTEK